MLPTKDLEEQAANFR
jgi:hypothetical protein